MVDKNIPTKISSMGIILVKSRLNELRVLVLECGGEWVFPKGHVMPGENFIETACREVKEESAVEIKPEECIGLVHEFSFYFDGEKANKLIKVHAFEISETQPIIYNEVEDFTNGKWMTSEEAFSILTHDDVKDALKKALIAFDKGKGSMPRDKHVVKHKEVTMNNNIIKGVPSVKEAYLLLEEAGKLNPGPWIEHSKYAAKAARLIAKQCSHLDPDKAFVLGLLHDIGRRAGKTWMRHAIDGYNFAMLKGYDILARICITHSFDCKDITTAFGEWDCTATEYNFVQEYLEIIEYDDYDKLIQLCDALALPKGFCLIEKRMVESTIRNGIHENVVLKWKSTMENKKYFENIMGKSIYSALPGVVENTFDF